MVTSIVSFIHYYTQRSVIGLVELYQKNNNAFSLKLIFSCHLNEYYLYLVTLKIQFILMVLLEFFILHGNFVFAFIFFMLFFL